MIRKVIISGLVICIAIFVTASIYAGTAAPRVVKLSSLSSKYEPVRFDHEKHTAIAGNCGMCHHQHGNSSSLPCKDCHSVTPSTFKSSVANSFMACRNCHGEYNPASPGMPGLKAAYHKACFQCHRGMGNVGLDPKGCTETCHASIEQKVSMKVKK